MTQLLPTVIVLFGATVSTVEAQGTLEGRWEGEWRRSSATLAVSFDFQRSNTAYTGQFGSTQLRVVGIPLSKFRARPRASTSSWLVARRHPFLDQAVHLDLDVRLNLLLEVALAAPAELHQQPSTGSGPSTRAMDSTRRFHRPLSVRNCLRPSAVSE
jgi:hypothetical protein